MDFLSGMVRAMTTPANNEVIRGDGFYISYNPAPAWGGEAGDETALVNKPADGSRGVFLILNGDFRDEYRGVMDSGYEACRAVYDKHKAEHRCSWSEDE